MGKEEKGKKGRERGKALLMPGQFQVMSLGDMLQKIMEEDLRKYCVENGLDPDEHKPVYSNYLEDK